MSNAKPRLCRECGTPLDGDATKRKQYCGNACRKTFNNRRAERGALMYDLFMAVRYDRSRAADLQLWSKLCRYAEDCREKDVAERNGRASYLPAREVLDRNPSLSTRIALKVR
jgi:hypothetical protein